jgi:hypothetical protein
MLCGQHYQRLHLQVISLFGWKQGCTSNKRAIFHLVCAHGIGAVAIHLRAARVGAPRSKLIEVSECAITFVALTGFPLQLLTNPSTQILVEPHATSTRRSVQ